MNFIGIDNGVSGSIAILNEEGHVLHYGLTPIERCLNYTKHKAWINRIRQDAMIVILKDYNRNLGQCLLERPLVNPARFKATISAIRALESTQIALESLKIPYEFIDSKEWQRELLPKGLQKEELKAASDSICKRLFPSVTLKHPGDGDSLLIAEYLRRKYTK